MREIRHFPKRPRPVSAPLPDLEPLLRIQAEHEKPKRDSLFLLWAVLLIALAGITASLGGC